MEDFTFNYKVVLAIKDMAQKLTWKMVTIDHPLCHNQSDSWTLLVSSKHIKERFKGMRLSVRTYMTTFSNQHKDNHICAHFLCWPDVY